jgi:hypothetical protein
MGRLERLTGLVFTQTAFNDPDVYDIIIYSSSAIEGSGFDAFVTSVNGNSYLSIRTTVARLKKVPVGTVYHVGMGHEVGHTIGFRDVPPSCSPSYTTMMYSWWLLDIDPEPGNYFKTVPPNDRRELRDAYGR